MKLFAAIGMVVFAALGACGNADELKAAQAKVDTLTKENATLKTAVNELNANIGKANAERDELKGQVDKLTAAAAAPPPAAAAKPAAKPGAKPAKPAKHK
jgi:peptidoglycan hydrolase CwlO-like protein